MHCEQCGAALRPEDVSRKQCAYCGTALLASAEAAEVLVVPPPERPKTGSVPDRRTIRVLRIATMVTALAFLPLGLILNWGVSRDAGVVAAFCTFGACWVFASFASRMQKRRLAGLGVPSVATIRSVRQRGPSRFGVTLEIEVPGGPPAEIQTAVDVEAQRAHILKIGARVPVYYLAQDNLVEAVLDQP